jgi:hypothetical protein
MGKRLAAGPVPGKAGLALVRDAEGGDVFGAGLRTSCRSAVFDAGSRHSGGSLLHRARPSPARSHTACGGGRSLPEGSHPLGRGAPSCPVWTGLLRGRAFPSLLGCLSEKLLCRCCDAFCIEAVVAEDLLRGAGDDRGIRKREVLDEAGAAGSDGLGDAGTEAAIRRVLLDGEDRLRVRWQPSRRPLRRAALRSTCQGRWQRCPWLSRMRCSVECRTDELACGDDCDVGALLEPGCLVHLEGAGVLGVDILDGVPADTHIGRLRRP